MINIPVRKKNTEEIIMTMRQYFQGISRKEKIMTRRRESVEESNEVSPADFSMYINSEHVKNMEKNIVEGNPVVVKGDHTNVRNFLIVNI